MTDPRAASPIRGSTLLLTGLILAAGIDFIAQVLLVRYLSKADFGAWSYALAIVALLSLIAQLEMGSTVARFLPIYTERGLFARARGAITVSVLMVAGLGIALAIAVVIAIQLLGLRPIDDPTTLKLLLLVTVLIPVIALDTLITGLFAAFGASRTIFVRHSVLGPGLRFAVVVALIAMGATVDFLAIGYVVVSVVGLAVYAAALRRVVNSASLPADNPPGRARDFPAGQLIRFAVPLLTSTIVWILMDTSDALLLGYFFDAEAVAAYRTVAPLARMNLFAFWSFTVLFTPTAARAHARSDTAELRELYWQTALWMTVLTFPVFTLTSSFAQVVVPTIYGAGYSESAPILALLSIGFFFSTALGFNALTVRIYGKLRYLIAVDLSIAVLSVLLSLALIPPFGPIGAAAGTAAMVILHTLLKHVGLWRFTGVTIFPMAYVPIYAGMLGLATGLFVVHWLLPVGLPVAVLLSGAAALAAVYLARGRLRIDVLYPELASVPLLRRLTGARR